MSNHASQAVLVPFVATFVQRLERAGLPENIASYVGLYYGLAETMRKRNLTYLPLPALIAVVATNPLYHEALHWGRGFYFDDLHVYDETSDTLLRDASPFTREEILTVVKTYLLPADVRIAASIPLAWRVGIAVGWLSGLAVSQKDDAEAGMAVLAALVNPLILSSGQPNDCTKLPAKKQGTRCLNAHF